MSRPDFIDNIEGNTLARVLKEILEEGSQETEDGRRGIDAVRIASAYFSPSGFSQIASRVARVPNARILLGTDPISPGDQWKRPVDETDEQFAQRKLKERMRRQEESIRAERDHMPFTRETSAALERLAASLENGEIKVRRYAEQFLHAKAYIFTGSDPEKKGGLDGVIAGSSNLTRAGLASNLELNLGRYDPGTLSKAVDWFDGLWDKAEPYDLAELFKGVFEPRLPFEIFLRVLWELYGDEIEKDAEADGNLPLTSFQKHGVVRAQRLIDERGGVIVADEVGLGKTFIAGEILSRYRERRQRALLLCSAALRDSTWRKFESDYQIHLEVLSYEELAAGWYTTEQGEERNRKLRQPADDYQLVIIDEAHNYRNPDSTHRAGSLRKLLYGRRKDLLMLTATPVNNSLWDLYHLTRYFLKQDSALSHKGILSIRQKFETAMRMEIENLSPEVLYPIIDETTVKRTRAFVKKHYPNDQIRGPDGKMMQIVFPQPRAITVKYDLDGLHSELFGLVERYLDPGHVDALTFARYTAQKYLHEPDPEYTRQVHAATGFLMSGLLKRFESSATALRISTERMIGQHEQFLAALDKGHVLTTDFFREISLQGDEDFDQMLEESEHTRLADDYEIESLKSDVRSDLEKLRELHGLVGRIEPKADPKLQELSRQLTEIAKQAREEADSSSDALQKRKVLIFSFFADSVRWVKEFLDEEVERESELEAYKGRTDMVVGSGKGEETDKADAAAKFSPETAGSGGGRSAGSTDILVCTDVLAEGVNLQQCRHVINYDLPWNPMRLVQRHGRIDRIGSRHKRIYLRTFFPTDRLENLLELEKRIHRKIAMAAKSIGVTSPVAEAPDSQQVFTETREEIEKLLREDSSIYERGGTERETQSGEEYRQTLRKALQERRDAIVNMPWKAGSVMAKGDQQGMFFCAKAGDRVYLRFIHCNRQWAPVYAEGGETGDPKPQIISELGTCLRIIECESTQPLLQGQEIRNAAYDLWLLVREAIWKDWMHEADPSNLQPKVRLLNQKVAQHIRSHPPAGMEQDAVDRALNIVETPWSRRDEKMLKDWYESDPGLPPVELSKRLAEKINNSGLEPAYPPDPLPPIQQEKINPLVWMAIVKGIM